jgi:hypothetical protein
MIQYVWGKKEQCGQELVQLLATELKHEGWERMNKNKYLFYSTYERAHNHLQTPLKTVLNAVLSPHMAFRCDCEIYDIHKTLRWCKKSRVDTTCNIHSSGASNTCVTSFLVMFMFGSPRYHAVKPCPRTQDPIWSRLHIGNMEMALRHAQHCAAPNLDAPHWKPPSFKSHYLPPSMAPCHNVCGWASPIPCVPGFGTGKDVAGVNTWHLWNHRLLLELQWKQESVIFRECYAV